jgi:hypothetical protein
MKNQPASALPWFVDQAQWPMILNDTQDHVSVMDVPITWPQYQIFLLDPGTGQPTLDGCGFTELGRFDDRTDAACAVARLLQYWPGTQWVVRELPETYWSARLQEWVTIAG